MTKAALRTVYKEKRLALPEKDRLRLDDLLLIKFQQLPLSYDVQVLLSYWPLSKEAEIDTFLLTDYLQFRLPHLQVAYPVTNIDELSFQAVIVNDDTEFALNKYGIAEPVEGMAITPAEIDMVFVPLLAFDTKGYRVGYGKGFYDRYLKDCRNDCEKIGFSYFAPVEGISDINQFDVPLTTGVTPEHLYEF
ncbi:MAG TPA: 5-formyltetrahydrofolate cyclo-ligase [Chitinophagaceae bacterium]|nr:5-formyltetrahydrofolate cyclo-ligase [Chitinophagaceae bacterium]